MDYMALLRRHDDPVHWEFPDSFDYDTARVRVEKFAAELHQVPLGKPEILAHSDVDIESSRRPAHHPTGIAEGVLRRLGEGIGVEPAVDAALALGQRRVTPIVGKSRAHPMYRFSRK